MRPWDPLNKRQLEVLRRISAGDDLSGQESAGLRISARALHGRGLVKVTRCDGRWQAAITGAGTFYIDHGHHPDHPGRDGPLSFREANASARRAATPTAQGQRKPRTPPALPVTKSRQAAAVALIRRLESEKRIAIENPDDDTIAEWRRVVDFAKRNKLVPPGTWIQRRKDWAQGLVIEFWMATRRTSASTLVARSLPSRCRPSSAPCTPSLAACKVTQGGW